MASTCGPVDCELYFGFPPSRSEAAGAHAAVEAAAETAGGMAAATAAAEMAAAEAEAADAGSSRVGIFARKGRELVNIWSRVART